MRPSSRPELLRRIIGYALLVAGGTVVLAVLPLWVWLLVLGVALVVVGWALVGTPK